MKAPARCLAAGGRFFVLRGKTEKLKKHFNKYSNIICENHNRSITKQYDLASCTCTMVNNIIQST